MLGTFEGFAGRLGLRAAAAFDESVDDCRLVFLVAGEEVLLDVARTAEGFLSPEEDAFLLPADDPWSTDCDLTYKLEVDLDFVMVAEEPLLPWFLAYKKGPGLLPLAPPDFDSKIFLVSLTVSGAGSSFSAKPKRTLVDLRLYDGLPARESWPGEIFLFATLEDDPFRDFSTMTMSSLARLLTAASTGNGWLFGGRGGGTSVVEGLLGILAVVSALGSFPLTERTSMDCALFIDSFLLAGALVVALAALPPAGGGRLREEEEEDEEVLA